MHVKNSTWIVGEQETEVRDKVVCSFFVTFCKVNEYPWIALLRMEYRNGQSGCYSGSLSAYHWVDTVAHCVSDDNKLLSNRIITVILGEHDKIWFIPEVYILRGRQFIKTALHLICCLISLT